MPYYHFEHFSPETSSEVNIQSIALLVNYYDQENNRWIAETEISGNDFILTKEFKIEYPETVKDNIKLIAARDFIDVSLEEYLDILSKEFLVWTQRDGGQWRIFKVNKRSSEAMTEQEITKGILSGLQLREENKSK